MTTIVLLTISNIFMTFAWYGHLKYRSTPLPKVIFVSWLIASMEYCFQVPAKPDRFLRIHDGAAEDHSGSDNPYGVFRLLGAVSEGIAEVELRGGIRDDGGRGFRDFQEMLARNGASRVPVDCHLP